MAAIVNLKQSGRQAHSVVRSRSHPTCSKDVRQSIKETRSQGRLLGRVLDEANTSLDVGLQALDRFL